MHYPAIHINDMRRQMDICRIMNRRVDIWAWRSTGETIHYDGWLVKGGHWRGGVHRLMNPDNGQIRAVPDIFIFKFNKHSIYL
jgi:hypothetical protein